TPANTRRVSTTARTLRLETAPKNVPAAMASRVVATSAVPLTSKSGKVIGIRKFRVISASTRTSGSSAQLTALVTAAAANADATATARTLVQNHRDRVTD